MTFASTITVVFFDDVNFVEILLTHSPLSLFALLPSLSLSAFVGPTGQKQMMALWSMCLL